jgi:2-oxoglutarate ferredoxin oxidoreductase subunit beta
MLKWFKDHTTPLGSESKKKNPELIERGIFVNKKIPEYCSEYQKLVQRAMKAG